MEIEKRIESEEIVGEKEIKNNNNSKKTLIKLLRVKSEKVAYIPYVGSYDKIPESYAGSWKVVNGKKIEYDWFSIWNLFQLSRRSN